MSDFALIKDTVKVITVAIKKNLLVDWFKKPDVRAVVMLTVRRTLTRKGVQQGLQEILNEIMKQAEPRYREWYEGGGVSGSLNPALRLLVRTPNNGKCTRGRPTGA